MKLQNFRLSPVLGAISLTGTKREWDLHNIGTFSGLTYHVDRNEVRMEWCFSLEKRQLTCALVFRGVMFLLMLPDLPDILLSEAECVSGIFFVRPQKKEEPLNYEYRMTADLENGESFNMVFLLQSGRSIEIGAEIVELVETECGG
jgi:hypothetical protein